MEAYGAGLVGSHVAKLPTTRKGRAGCVRRRGLFPLFVCSMFASNGGEALSVSIDDFGAVPGDTSVEVAFANSDAIYQALIRANTSEDSQRAVCVPEGKQYHFMPVVIRNLVNVTLEINGDLIASNHTDSWPRYPYQDKSLYTNIFNFTGCEGFTVTGVGLIHGRGFKWWLDTLIARSQDQRPHILNFYQSRGLIIENIRLLNSPMFHIKLQDVEDVVIRGIAIVVDITQQTELLVARRLWNATTKMPIFPLNTDGIDPAGRNIHIHNISVTNFDDVVAVKPSEMSGKYANCSENILVENVSVKFGVGMTIGSVPPRKMVSCIRNVTFRNINFKSPFKAIYVKTNPGNHGHGIIDNITYENIHIQDPIWWSVYVGPQQQHQPDGSGPGCLFYPLDKVCQTQPRVTISNIHLKNITSVGDLLRPGILRCNETNPCRNITFEDVNMSVVRSEPAPLCLGMTPAPNTVSNDPLQRHASAMRHVGRKELV